MACDRDGLVEAGASIGNRVGNLVQHRLVSQNLLCPSSPEVLGEAEGPPAAQHLAVEVQTTRGPSARTVRTDRIDPPDATRNARVNRNTRPDSSFTAGPGLNHLPGNLVAEHERKRPQRHQCRGRTGVVREEMEIAAADPPGGYLDPHPVRARQIGSRQVHERGRKGRIDEIKLNCAHPRSVRGGATRSSCRPR